MEINAEDVKNIRSLALCKEILRQAVEQVDQLKSDYDEACGRLQTANLIKNEQLAATLRQKYRRCLNNAWWILREEFFAEDCRDERWVNWAIRWYKRWLKIADQFKEAK